MQFTQSLIALVACFLPLIAGAPAPEPNPELKIRNINARDIVPNSYIVVYNKDINGTAFDSEIASVNTILTKRGSTHKGIGAKYNLEGFKGYQIEADAATIGQIAASPEVRKHSETSQVPHD
jgi:hypothetical protein